MSKRNKPRGGQRKLPFKIIKQESVETLITRLLLHPFDVALAALIVLCDCDPTITELPVVKRYMGALTEAEQQYAAMLELALQANKVRADRMEEAVKDFNTEFGRDLKRGDAARDEQFAEWLPSWNAEMQRKWREENPEAAAQQDKQEALNATLDQGVTFLQGTAPVQVFDAPEMAEVRDYIERNPDAMDPV